MFFFPVSFLLLFLVCLMGVCFIPLFFPFYSRAILRGELHRLLPFFPDPLIYAFFFGRHFFIFLHRAFAGFSMKTAALVY